MAMPGGEEAAYVVLELPGTEALPAVGEEMVLKGMDTLAPSLQLPNGNVLAGRFEEVPATQLVVADSLGVTLAATGQLPPAGLVQTDKKIVFQRTVAGAGKASATGLPPS